MARPQLAKADTAFQGASVGQPTEPPAAQPFGCRGRRVLRDQGYTLGSFGPLPGTAPSATDFRAIDLLVEPDARAGVRRNGRQKARSPQ
jgi:hypothetical protein